MIKLRRSKLNPILTPSEKNWWEKEAVFNPGVCQKDGRVFLLYRAIGEYEFYVSRLGLARSDDGVRFRRVNREPILEPTKLYDRWGCEDPRITSFSDGRFFITYAALSEPANNGGGPPATALLSTKDFKNFRRYGIVTPFGSDNRDVVLFPEKIKRKYIMLHRPHRWTQRELLRMFNQKKSDIAESEIWFPSTLGNLPDKPSIWIAWSNNLREWFGHKILMKPTFPWEAIKIGAGAPPIKTEKGWLLIYHGVDNQKVYRVGAALLDLKTPSKVVARLPYPILEPEKPYEKEGDIPNVVFPTGVIICDGVLFIYYGAADKVIGVATIKLNLLLEELEKYYLR